jgi:hypothetical protein
MAEIPLSPARPGSDSLGVSKLQQMEDDMKRRGLLRKVRQVGERYPQVLNSVLRNRSNKAPARSNSMGTGVIHPALEKKYGGRSAATGAFPGSPAYYGANWGVSPEERKAAETYENPYFGPEGDDRQAQARIREQLLESLEESDRKMSAIDAKYAGTGVIKGGAGTTLGNVPKPEQVAAINKDIARWEQKARLADDGTEEGQAKAARFMNEAKMLQARQQAVATPVPAPAADIANRASWALDPNMIPAMLTNRPEVLAGANALLNPVDQALASQFGPTSPVNLSGNLGPAPAPITPDQIASGEAEDEAALSAAKAKKKAKKKSSDSGNGDDSDSEG